MYMMKMISISFFLSISTLCFSCSKKGLVAGRKVVAKEKGAGTLLANDPFRSWLTSIPAIVNTISVVNSGSGASAITTKKFRFSARGGVDTVYAIMAYPQQAGTYPGILMLHGGGSNAEGMLTNVQSFAARGYVTLSIDQPGICGTNNTPNSTGPWKSKPGGEGPRFVVTPAPDASTLADAGIANLQAFNLLRSQSNVNPAKMGIMGSSWGGYSTTLLSGLLGNKVTAAYSHFGCGYYDKGSFWTNIISALSADNRNTWLANFDAGRRAANMSAAYFIESPSNDTYFWPEAVRATMDASASATKNLVIAPNLNHVNTASSGTMKNVYFDYYLKNTGAPFGKIAISGVTALANGGQQITMEVVLPAGVQVSSVKLYYSEPAASWQVRNWVAIDAVLISGSTYQALMPATVAAKHPDFYAYLTDSRTIVTSSYMQK